MRIQKVHIPQSETEKIGLKEVKLVQRPLGSVVALVGKNGSGKSRVLSLVNEYIKNLSAERYLEGHISNLPNNFVSKYLKHHTHASDLYKRSLQEGLIKKDIDQLVTEYKAQLKAPLAALKRICPHYVKVITSQSITSLQSEIEQKNSNTFENLLSIDYNIFDNVDESVTKVDEFNNIGRKNTLEYIRTIVDDLTTDQFNLSIKFDYDKSNVTKELEEHNSYKQFSRLKYFIKTFLGKELSTQASTSKLREANSSKTILQSTLYLDQTEFSFDLLSPGQKILFTYAMMFYFMEYKTRTNIKDSIIIIDEPELHLHPEAQIKLIDSLKLLIADTGQLWIATHSIHILSHLQNDEIYMMTENELLPPSRYTPGKSFNDLMGVDQHIYELTTFVNSISSWTVDNFIRQCFQDPDVLVSENRNDPQFVMFKEFVKKKDLLNLLDYGAGKGRIGLLLDEDDNTKKKVSYHSFEPDTSHFNMLTKLNNQQAVYTQESEIPQNYFDVVLLCNVLHEISPSKWLNVFRTIKQSLTENGFLVFIEDLQLPKGEYAHESGYLILSADEFQTLVNTDTSDINEKVVIRHSSPLYSDRLVLVAITKDKINPTEDSIFSSIRLLNENALSKIKELREVGIKNPSDASIGRKYANQLQLYINSILALEKLEGNNNSI